MLRTSLWCVAILALLNGCATYPAVNHERMQTLPRQYAEFDAKLAWEVKSLGESTVIDGFITNIRYYEMDDVEIWVTSLDVDGKETQRAVDFVHMLKENESAAFKLKIPKVVSGTKLHFMYKYIGQEGGDSGDSMSWRQSFDSVVP